MSTATAAAHRGDGELGRALGSNARRPAKSKEEILHAAIDTGFIAALRTAFAHVDRNERPFDAVRKELPRLVSRFESKKSIAVERLMRSTEALWARK